MALLSNYLGLQEGGETSDQFVFGGPYRTILLPNSGLTLLRSAVASWYRT